MKWNKPEVFIADSDEVSDLIEEFETYHRENALLSQENFIDDLIDQMSDKGYLTVKQLEAFKNVVEQIEEYSEVWK